MMLGTVGRGHRARALLFLFLIGVMLTHTVDAQSGARGRGRSRGPVSYEITVQPNVSQAALFVDGERQGTGSQSVSLVAGTYIFTLRASGFYEWSRVVQVADNETIVAELEPLRAQFEVVIPASILDPGDRDARDQVEVLVDGRAMARTTFEIPPGRHTIEVRSGGLAARAVVDAAPGASYTVQPFFSLQVE